MQLKILFLDDEIELCEIFRDFFAEDGVEVHTFSVPAEAIKASQATHFDLIFLDYRLPGTTGDLVAKQMPESIVKYMITGELGVSPAYPFKKIFQKPFDPNQIQAVIDQAKAL